MDAPVFGEVADVSAEFDVKPEDIVPFTLVAYDAVPHPPNDAHPDGPWRQRYTRTFHAAPKIKGEKVIAGYARGKRAEDGSPMIDAHSLSRMILSMLVVEERDEFLDFLEDPNLAFAGEMFGQVMDFLVESAADLPKEQSDGSSGGQHGRAGLTSTGGASRPPALAHGT
jgi:hypothetical protein